VAISFITEDDRNPLRSLERFMKKSIIRRRAKGFVCTPLPNNPAPSKGGGRGPAKGQASKPGQAKRRRSKPYGLDRKNFKKFKK